MRTREWAEEVKVSTKRPTRNLCHAVVQLDAQMAFPKIDQIVCHWVVAQTIVLETFPEIVHCLGNLSILCSGLFESFCCFLHHRRNRDNCFRLLHLFDC